MEKYRAFEDGYQQAMWEAAHDLPFPVGIARQIRSWSLFAKRVGNADRDLGLDGKQPSALTFKG